MKSASKVWPPILYIPVTCAAVSLERTLGSASFFCAAGAFTEPPNMSKCVSCITAAYHGPLSHLSAIETNLGLRVEVCEVSDGFPVEYCTKYCNPPKKVGDAKSMALPRRSWKRDALLGPPAALANPTWRSSGLVCTKLPLETPRKPTTSPAFLKGVSMKPSLKVPQPASMPRKLSRVASVPSTPSSIGTTDSTCQIALIPLPIDLPPLNPRYELPISISPRFVMLEFPPFDTGGVPATLVPDVMRSVESPVVPFGVGFSPLTRAT